MLAIVALFGQVGFSYFFLVFIFLPGSICEIQAQTGNDLFPQLPIGAVDSENVACREDSLLFQVHLRNNSLWAHKMYDASAKSVTGILHGSAFQMGHWDECRKVGGPLRTQFCLVGVNSRVPTPHPARDPFSLSYDPLESVLRRIHKSEDRSQQARDTVHVGLCVPASCSFQDLERALKSYLDAFAEGPENVTFSATVAPEMCQAEDEEADVEPEDIAFCLVVLALVTLVAVGSAYDARADDPPLLQKGGEKKIKPGLPGRLLVCFSLSRNFHDLPKSDDSNPALSVLYGLRTVAIFMIIMDHRFGTFVSSPILNHDFIEQGYRSMASWFLFHGDLFVDTFFILSGILVTYGLLGQFDKKFIHPGFLVLLRYIRLTPLFAFVIFYTASVYAHTGSGPLWKAVVYPEVLDCRKNWWASLIYLGNYINVDEMCMVHSWYLPCDFHYFILGIFLVMLIKRNARLGLALLTALFLASIAIPFLITVAYSRPALLHFFPEFLIAPRSHPDFHYTYIKSHTRASTYFVGMYAGYVYYKLKGRDYQLSKFHSHCALLVSLVLLFGGMSSGAVFYDPYHPYERFEAAAYASLHRPAWGFGTIGLLFVASFGRARLLRNALSWSPWIPLSKLVYGAYLIHMSFAIRQVGNTQSPKFFSYFDIICMGLGDICLAFSVALLMYLAIEAPFRKVFRELLMPARSRPATITPENHSRDNVSQQPQPTNESRL